MKSNLTETNQKPLASMDEWEDFLKARWTVEGVEAKSFNAALLHEPHTIANKQGKPFQVFTPFWRHCLELPVEAPARLAPATAIPAPERWPAGLE
ncbi:MAG: deoxyribodipyrimidine photo-lyase, partial [Opitutaceae bacterium]